MKVKPKERKSSDTKRKKAPQETHPNDIIKKEKATKA